MNKLLKSQIIERGAQKRFHLDASSEAALDAVVSCYGMRAAEFLRKLEHIFAREIWPWAVVLMRRELPLAAHFMETRGVHRNLPMLSYSFVQARKRHDQGIPPSGALLFPSRGIARRLAKVSPVIRAWWPLMQNLSTETTHLLIVDEPDSGLVAELAVDLERRVQKSQRMREEAEPPSFDIPCARAKYLLYTAGELYASGCHEQFLYHAREMQRYFPNHITLPYRMAQALLMLGRRQEALDTNRPVIKKLPRLVAALELHGLAAEPLGLYRLAEACYRRAVAIDFCSVTAWRGLFRLHKRKGHLQGMLKAVATLEELECADTQNWIDAGEALIEAARFEEAVWVMEANLLKHPEDPFCLNNYAFALVKQGRAVEAIPFCEAALRLAPDQPILLDTQALLFHQLGRSQEALAVIDHAIAIQPDWQTAWATKELIRSGMNGSD